MSKKPSKFIALLISLVLIFQPVVGYSLPEGWEVQFGNANFDYDTLNQILNIFMSSDRLITNWESFSIALNEIVNFFMPSADSIALNRVVGMDPSQILGHLNSNGKIFLINPNGILFGSNSRVDAAGLVASTLNITNEDFLAGRFAFFGQGGSVVNQGFINTPGGYAVLLGSNVENAGIIEASLGSVALAAGQRITLNLDPQGLISVVVDEAVTQNLTGAQDAVKNTGRITADGGRVILTASALDGVFNRAINNEGIIEAGSLVNRRGEVYLLASGENSVVSNTGTIDVSAKESGAIGGFVELSGGQLDFVNGIINTGETGEVVFDPWNFYIGDLVEWFLQHLSGSATIKARNNIYTILGDFGGDDILNLYNFVTGRTFTLQAGNSIYLNNDSIVTNGGNIRLLADAAGDYGWPWGWVNSDGVGDIYLGTGGGLHSNGGDISLSGVNINLTALVNAGSGNVDINATDKIIDDDDSGALDIIGNRLLITAVNGIGSGNAIETQINQLSAYNSTLGDISISNIGPLELVALVELGLDLSIYNEGAGNVNISTGSPLNVNSGVWANGNINLSALGAGTGNLNINADIYSSLGNILLNAGNDIFLNDGTVSADSGSIGLEAGHNINIGNGSIETVAGNINLEADNDIIFSGPGQVASGSGNISLLANNNIGLGYVSTSGNVSATAVNGAITDNNSSIVNIIANNITLTAANGIGSAADSLDIDLGSGKLTLDTSAGSGDIYVDETNGDLTLDDAHFAVSTGAGAQYIKLRNRGGGFNITGDVYIPVNDYLFLETTVPGTDIYFDGGSLRSTGNSSTMSLISAGRIYRNNLFGGNIDIYAAGVGLKAVNGIDLALSVASLGAMNTGSGDINIFNNRALDISSGAVWGIGGLFNANGNINLATNGNLTLSYSGWPYNTTVYGQNVRLTANGGAIIDGNGSNSNIIANNLILGAANGIGSGDALETQIYNLQATNTNSGNIEINNTGALNIFGNGVRNFASGGNVNLSASSPLYIIDAPISAYGDIILTANGADGDIITGGNQGPVVQSFGGSIMMNAARNIILGQGGYGDVYAIGPGNIILNALRNIFVHNNTWVFSDSGNIEFNAGNNIAVFNAWLRSGLGNILFNAGNDIGINNSQINSIFGNIRLRAGDSMFVNDSLLNSIFGNISLIAGDNLLINDSTLNSIFGGIYLRAGDNLFLNDSLLRSVFGDIRLRAGDNMFVNDSTLDSVFGDISLRAGDNLFLNDSMLNTIFGNIRLRAGDNMIVNNSIINSLLGNIALLVGNNLLLNNSFLSSGHLIDLIAGGKITQNGGAIGSGHESININAGGDILLSNVRGNDVWIWSDTGTISDYGATSIFANDLALRADKGINLHTAVSRLFAHNQTSGDINIANTGALELVDLPGWGYAINNLGGSVNISTSSPLTVNSAVLANNNINLLAGGGTTGDLFINADVHSSNGNVSLSADNNILINDGTISSAALIELLAGGGIVQAGGTIGSGIESINLDANKDILLSNVRGNDVWIWSDTGTISDYGATSIFANDLALRADKGINLHTAVSRLFAHNQTSGDINLTNTGALELFDLPGWGYSMNNAGTGNINLITDQGLDITDAVLAHDGNVNINAGADINISQIIAMGNGSTTGNIFLNSGGSILGLGGNIHLISAADTHLTAGGVVGGPGAPLMVSVGKDLYLAMGNAFGSASGSVGLLGVSGTLGGSIAGSFIFVPGTYAFNPFFVGNPPGYIFFNGSEIWPNLPFGNILNLLASGSMREVKLYLEFLQNYRFVSFDSSTPNFYFYHPSTPSDTAAFDDITLDAGAYDFIDGNLNLKKKDALSPYYEEQQAGAGKAI